MGDHVKLRIPALEIFATQYGDSFSGSSRALSSAEINTAWSIFEQSVAYHHVRIINTMVAAAPTTLGNHIRIPPGYALDDETLIHEMVHIWQFQTKGNGYISDSVFHQVTAMINGGDRNAAYRYQIVAGKSLYDYTAEQQAMIIQDYFSDTALQKQPDYQRMLRELRSARPVLSKMDRYLESLYGNTFDTRPRWDRLPPGIANPTEIAPIIRLEF